VDAMTDHEKREAEALKAIREFVEEGKWPKPGVLPTCVVFRKRYGGV
jgi:hypothetical protein